MTVIEANVDIPAQFAGQVFGALDSNVKRIERAFDVSVISRDSGVKVLGEKDGTGKAVEVLKTLLSLAESGSAINEQTVDYAIDMAGSENTAAITEIDKDFEGDVSFPKIDENEWKIVSKEKGPEDGVNDFDYDYVTYVKE